MPNTSPENNQVNNENMAQLSPEEAKASLGIATRLQEELLMAQNPMPVEEPIPQATPDEEMEVEEQSDQRIRAIVQEEIGALKDELMDVLKDEPEEA